MFTNKQTKLITFNGEDIPSKLTLSVFFFLGGGGGGGGGLVARKSLFFFGLHLMVRVLVRHRSSTFQRKFQFYYAHMYMQAHHTFNTDEQQTQQLS